jgi:hypothetical protein
MKKIVLLILVSALVSACSTPKTMLKNEKTGQVVSCGGSATGSLVGGVVGYHIQKSNDASCESDYMAQGFKRVQETPGTIGDH